MTTALIALGILFGLVMSILAVRNIIKLRFPKRDKR